MYSLQRQSKLVLFTLVIFSSLCAVAEAFVPTESLLLGIPEYKKELIRKGYHAPYNAQTIKRVVGRVRIAENGALINLPGPEFVPTLLQLRTMDRYQLKNYKPEFTVETDPFESWTDRQKRAIDILFWTSQILDVYSTYRGVQYDCIYEANPLLNEVPTVPEMIGLKTGVIGIMYSTTKDNREFWYGWKLGAGVTTSLVAANNFRLLRKAQQNCDKR